MRERELADANAAIEGLQGQVVALKHENASLAKSVQVLSLLAVLVQKYKCWLAFGVFGGQGNTSHLHSLQPRIAGLEEELQLVFSLRSH